MLSARQQCSTQGLPGAHLSAVNRSGPHHSCLHTRALTFLCTQELLSSFFTRLLRLCTCPLRATLYRQAGKVAAADMLMKAK